MAPCQSLVILSHKIVKQVKIPFAYALLAVKTNFEYCVQCKCAKVLKSLENIQEVRKERRNFVLKETHLFCSIMNEATNALGQNIATPSDLLL